MLTSELPLLVCVGCRIDRIGKVRGLDERGTHDVGHGGLQFGVGFYLSNELKKPEQPAREMNHIKSDMSQVLGTYSRLAFVTSLYICKQFYHISINNQDLYYMCFSSPAAVYSSRGGSTQEQIPVAGAMSP